MTKRITATAALAFLAAIAAGSVLAQTPAQSDLDKQWQEKKKQLLEGQRKQEEQQKATPAAKSPPGNAFKWANNITNLNLGEWFPLSFSHDGEVVKYATLKDAQRQGHIATVWFRNEFRDQQKRAGVIPYRSGVERVQFDCAGRVSRVVVQAVYSENSLGGKVKSYPSPDSPWERVVPGSPGEQWIDWACNATATTKAPPPTQ